MTPFLSVSEKMSNTQTFCVAARGTAELLETPMMHTVVPLTSEQLRPAISGRTPVSRQGRLWIEIVMFVATGTISSGTLKETINSRGWRYAGRLKT